MVPYGFYKEVASTFDETYAKIIQNLAQEGFGVLSEINVSEKFKQKLNVDFPRYLILGACHPESAHKAIVAEPNIGLMLPCNVIIYKKEQKTVVSAIKPTVAMQMIDNQALLSIARQVEEKLKRVFDSI